jgi:hypothetical protein
MFFKNEHQLFRLKKNLEKDNKNVVFLLLLMMLKYLSEDNVKANINFPITVVNMKNLKCLQVNRKINYEIELPLPVKHSLQKSI